MSEQFGGTKQFPFYGLLPPKRKALCKVFLKNFKKSGAVDWKFLYKCWGLQDYSKTDPQWAKNFIEAHGKQMNPLSIREASKYL